MQLRWVLIAAGLVAAPALAETPKSTPPQAAPVQQPQPKAVVLASADAAKPANEAAQPAPAEPRHRFARVTTCRCGDPQPADAGEDSPER
jgi:hypothetical protein